MCHISAPCPGTAAASDLPSVALLFADFTLGSRAKGLIGSQRLSHQALLFPATRSQQGYTFDANHGSLIELPEQQEFVGRKGDVSIGKSMLFMVYALMYIFFFYVLRDKVDEKDFLRSFAKRPKKQLFASFSVYAFFLPFSRFLPSVQGITTAGSTPAIDLAVGPRVNTAASGPHHRLRSTPLPPSLQPLTIRYNTISDLKFHLSNQRTQISFPEKIKKTH
ncbi:hypothetical protein L1887_18146 [Cichorium endivia]|nr:hypothetical protein L1887_18144 [Cichorium endivia]KAI3511005.1 hypothetical protein L1887_18146 [Cichorium endivia]